MYVGGYGMIIAGYIYISIKHALWGGEGGASISGTFSFGPEQTFSYE